MLKKTAYWHKHITVWSLAFIICSCKKLVDAGLPRDLPTDATVFADSAMAQSVVADMYATMNYNEIPIIAFNSPPGPLWDCTALFTTLSADDSYYFPGYYYDAFQNNMLTTSGIGVYYLWTGFYAIIYKANNIIEGLQQAPAGIPAEVKNRLMGEAECVRAFCHFYLVNLYGDVPLIITTNLTQTRAAWRTGQAEVYKQIVADLTDAQNRLSTDYSYSKGERTRVNKWAATALLARAYLYLGNWAAAEEQAAAVINSGLYTLETDLNQVFLAGSQETIWQLSTAPANYTYTGQVMNPDNGVPNFVIRNGLLAAFETGDNRKTKWIQSVIYNNVGYNYPYKYKLYEKNSGVTEYDVILRLAEQYLIRAEARANLGKISEAQADLNTIRSRAGLPGTTANSRETLLQAVEQERRVELFCEGAHRWFDLKRTNRADAVLREEKSATWKPTAILYPIPQQAIQTNANLTQNPGY